MGAGGDECAGKQDGGQEWARRGNGWAGNEVTAKTQAGHGWARERVSIGNLFFGVNTDTKNRVCVL